MIGVEVLLPGFVFGIANSAHCAGMCGVFAAQASSAASGNAVRTALYLFGKTCTYVFIGAIAGTLGATALAAGSTAQLWLGGAVGLVLVAAGIQLLRGKPAAPSGVDKAWTAMLRPIINGLRQAHVVGGPVALGAASGLLPCGVVYLAALLAAAHGNALDGAATMGAFGLGTVPVLVGVATLGRTALTRLGPDRLRRAGGALILLTGIAGLVRVAMPLLADAPPGTVPGCH